MFPSPARARGANNIESGFRAQNTRQRFTQQSIRRVTRCICRPRLVKRGAWFLLLHIATELTVAQ